MRMPSEEEVRAEMDRQAKMFCVCGIFPHFAQAYITPDGERWRIRCPNCERYVENAPTPGDAELAWIDFVSREKENRKIPTTDELNYIVARQKEKEKQSNVRATLEERGKRYGNFETHAEISQALKDVAKPYYHRLRPIHRETLDMIFTKIARMLNGDPEYTDNPHDMAGFSTLLEDNIRERKGKL